MLCPFCKEEIKDEAIFCKHCKSDLTKATQAKSEQLPKPPKKPFYNRTWFWVVVVLVVFGIIGSEANKSSTSPSSDGATNQAVNSAPSAPSNVPSQSIMKLKGDGSKTTQIFTVTGNWNLNWAYDCSSFANGQGNFQVYVNNGGGTQSPNIGVNQLGSKDTGTENYHIGGTFYLVVNSECGWSVQVLN